MPTLRNPRLISYLNTNALVKNIDKGALIVDRGYYSIVHLDPLGKGVIFFKIRGAENWETKNQNVQVSGFASENSIILSSCDCSYEQGGICMHRVAAIYALDKYLQTKPILQKSCSMSDVEANLSDISDEELKRNTSSEIWKNRISIKSVKILTAMNGVAEMLVTYKKNEFKVRFNKTSPNKIHTTCSCNQELFYPLCEHKIAALLVLRQQFGKKAFDVLRDWTKEKNNALAEYGFSLADDLTKKFDFKITDDAKLLLIKLDPTIHKLSQFQDWKGINQKLFRPLPQSLLIKEIEEEEKYEQILFFLINPQFLSSFPDIKITPMMARKNLKSGKLTHISTLDSRHGSPKILPPISTLDSKIIALNQQFEQGELVEYLRSQNLVKGWYVSLDERSLSEEAVKALQDLIGEKYEKLLPLLVGKQVMLSPDTGHQISTLREVTLRPERVKPSFELKEDNDFVILDAFLRINTEKIPTNRIEKVGFWFVKHQDNLYKIANANDANLLKYFSDKSQIKVKKQNFEGFFSEFVLPLTENAEVNFKVKNEFKHENLIFKESRLYLKEDEDNLIILPSYVYQDYENPEEEIAFGEDSRTNKIIYENDKILILQRNAEREFETYSFVESLHPNFAFQGNYPFFYLPFADVIKNNWLFEFFDKVKEKQVPVFGFKDLKKLRYNPNRPKMQIRNSSGIDWFDMAVDISFGDQFVSLTDLKKALVKKQNYVELKDGTLGMLPEEWLNRYAQLFKMGTVKDDTVKLSKLHFNIIDELLGDIDDVALAHELAEKKEKLLHFKGIEAVPLPQNIEATLRDYQVEGYKWLHFLDEFGWGGCLADDMGLGKTLQMLTFLQEQQNREPSGTNLIVLPTTLIFNWQAEAAKFCPQLKIFVHKGVVRSKDIDFFKDFDLILTTYGMVRSDIEILKNFEFNYIVLDESQAIKNTDSLISKAVRLLRGRNRLVMTGTPVENNTFDLYSQMEFLNPGFLGSQEFFRSEFANPIDKHQDKDVAKRLRTLIKPFMLKRTKEEVAKDLPEKTETILFCEMGKKQRKVYDTYRETYRRKIVEKMATDGKEKSAFLILEGLLKLRQICDSPELLSDDADYGGESAKLEEILREIEENASNHKIVIFSQFLKMLDLIRQHLEKHHITYEYLDGQTTDRAIRVNRFQENEHCRIFLMSLKAGGVGINLTEADYVYLVDPWWNPAVEQQAIDRTHRIGQKKSVFAYRMICKDSIEEKILQLQAKKKDIAEDLISTEAGFIKKLTREDVVELFS